MCGITGVIRFDGAPVDVAILDAMVDRLVHRGPDDRGTWTDGSVGFGHARLSIIDVDGSPQPMASTDDASHITFNGEILNFKELRTGLAYPFRTNGDTEVLLALHLAHGEDMLAQLRGQFAFAIHDAAEQRVVLARDHVGILPLYWYQDESLLAFASEVHALVPALPQRLAVDETSIADYLARRAVPAPHTLFAGIRKVRPGHRLRVGLDGHVDESPYWTLPPAGEVPTDAVTAVERVARAVTVAVERNLVADVPVGAYLSGGVDSSLIVAVMSALREGAGVETFAAGFADERFDELPHAREVSTQLGTTHHEVTVTAQDFATLWPRLARHRGAPVSEPADVAVFRLAELARQSVKVVLSGEGSDELFAGYPKYRYARLAQPITAVPSRVRSPSLDRLERVLPAAASRPRTMLRALAGRDENEVLESWFAPFTGAERRRLLGRADGYGQRDVVARARGDVVRRMLYVDCHGWLADNLLERGDRMSMAASLELRPPFLDVDLVELAFSLPTAVKVRNGVGKWVVKEVARRYLPDAIVDRRKVGFRVPLDAWFRAGLRDMAHDLLTGPSSFVGGLMDKAAVRELLATHESGRRNEDIRIWTLLSLEVWHREFFAP
jgi:asparagine synthase (glutamine-hydrolysing)